MKSNVVKRRIPGVRADEQGRGVAEAEASPSEQDVNLAVADMPVMPTNNEARREQTSFQLMTDNERLALARSPSWGCCFCLVSQAVRGAWCVSEWGGAGRARSRVRVGRGGASAQSPAWVAVGRVWAAAGSVPVAGGGGACSCEQFR